ncbi:putative ribonuclease H-like domain-containing protein [Tanacetum coccineum]
MGTPLALSSKDAVVDDKQGYANSTNRVSTVSPSVSAAGECFTNVDDLPTNPLMPDLEDTADFLNTGIFSGAYDDEDEGSEADFNNLETTINVGPIPITRIHKDHPKEQIIGDINSASQTRRMTKIYEEHAMKDERGIVVRNKARLVAQGYTQEEGIDYDKVFTPIARIEAIRLFLAYASFIRFIVYQMDMKSAFLYGTIKEEVYVCQPPGFEDPQFSNKVYKVEKALYGLHQAPRAGYETLSTYLLKNGFRRGIIDKNLFIKKDKVNFLLVQRDDGIFISQDKYVANILKKFDFSSVKIASTLIETNKALHKDKEAKDVDVHLYRSMIGSLMYLTASRPNIMFAVCACARKSTTGGCQFLGKRLISWQCKKQTVVANSTTEVEYAAAANCYGHLLWIQNQMLDYGFNFMNTKIYIDYESTICIVKNPVFYSKTKHIEIRHHFIRDYYEKKLIQVIKIHTDHNVADILTKDFDVSRFKFLIASIGLLNLRKPITVLLSSQLKKTHKPRKSKRTTKISQSNGPIHIVANETVYKEWEDKMERAATTASSLEAEQDSGNINMTQSMATLNEPLPQGTGSSSGPRCQVTILGGVDAQTRFEIASKQSNDLPLLRVNTLGSREDSMKLKKLMELCTTYCDHHNMVGLLEKTDGSEGFYQIVDFLNASHIRFALSENPTIYDSHIKQFWQTATVNTLDNGEQEITAIVDGHVKTVTIASVRKYLQLADAGGLSSLPNTKFFDQLSLMGYAITSDKLTFQKGHFPLSGSVDVVHGGAATTISSIDAGQGSGNITKSPTMPYDSPLPGGHTLGNDEGSMTLHEFTVLCTNFSTKVESLETELKETNKTYGATFTKLIKKVKKLKQTVKISQARRRTIIITFDDVLARVAADEDFVQQLQAGEKCSEEDLPMKLVELVNQRKKFFAQ